MKSTCKIEIHLQTGVVIRLGLQSFAWMQCVAG